MNNIEISPNKIKKMKVGLIIESVLLGLIIMGIFFLSFVNYIFNDGTEHLLIRATSPDEKNSVTIYEVGNPVFFGNSTVRVYCHNTVFETQICNDGAALSDYNYSIKWENDVPVITFRGEEQEDVVYRIS